MRRDVVGVRRAALQRQFGGGPEAEEIGAERLAGEIDAAARGDDPDQRQADAGGEQQPRIDARARPFSHSASRSAAKTACIPAFIAAKLGGSALMRG